MLILRELAYRVGNHASRGGHREAMEALGMHLGPIDYARA
jgi:hypothetical protein